MPANRAPSECFHCKEWVDDWTTHNCWTTTEAALTRDLSEDLRDAWDRLRETAVDFGEQRIYASHNSIMFSRKACYFFVRPRRSYLEVWFFLGRTLRAPQIRKVMSSSRVKVAHLVQVKHRDEVEAPITGWLQEAYESSDALTGQARAVGKVKRAPAKKKKRAGPAKKKRTARARSAARKKR
jgi:hypothetical protein